MEDVVDVDVVNDQTIRSLGIANQRIGSAISAVGVSSSEISASVTSVEDDVVISFPFVRSIVEISHKDNNVVSGVSSSSIDELKKFLSLVEVVGFFVGESRKIGRQKMSASDMSKSDFGGVNSSVESSSVSDGRLVVSEDLSIVERDSRQNQVVRPGIEGIADIGGLIVAQAVIQVSDVTQEVIVAEQASRARRSNRFQDVSAVVVDAVVSVVIVEESKNAIGDINAVSKLAEFVRAASTLAFSLGKSRSPERVRVLSLQILDEVLSVIIFPNFLKAKNIKIELVGSEVVDSRIKSLFSVLGKWDL